MKQRKIYYVPGMISLIFLPLLCVCYLENNKTIERCVEITSPERYQPNRNDGELHFDTTLLSRTEYKRKYIDFELNGDVLNDKQTIDLFNSKLLEITKKEDTITGIHINIKDGSKYQSMIEIIDICKKDSFRPKYAFYDNEFWYIYSKQNDSIKNSIRNKLKLTKANSHSGLFVNDVSYISSELPFWRNNNFASNILKFWPFFILFGLFFIISIRYTINKYIKNK